MCLGAVTDSLVPPEQRPTLVCTFELLGGRASCQSAQSQGWSSSSGKFSGSCYTDTSQDHYARQGWHQFCTAGVTRLAPFPIPSTLPPAIQVLVMPNFCVAPKALGTGRSYGQQKLSPKEMPALASLLSHFESPQGDSVKFYSPDRAQNAIHKQK